MGDFIKAALPWVVMGIAIIILGISHSKKKGSNNVEAKTQEEPDKENANYMTEGMCIGIALGSTGLFNSGTGISIGMLLGMVIGMQIKK